MRQYLIKVENNHYVPKGTPGHGFEGYLDLRLNPPDVLANMSQSVTVLQTAAKAFGQDPEKVFELIQRDLNNDDPDRDQQVGLFGFPAHFDMEGKRVSARRPVDIIANATNADGTKKYKLKVGTNTLVTRVLFSNETETPRAIGVEYLKGMSMYSADPRYKASDKGVKGQYFARREVIVSGGTFNTPQILKLSGVGPKEELEKFGIPVVVDLPGVGTNMQDNYEIGTIARGSSNFVSKGPQCTYGFTPNDPCMELWKDGGKGPYARGPLDSMMFKSSKANRDERDLFMWGDASAFRGFWPNGANQAFQNFDPATTFGFSMAKMHPYNRNGTVTLKSADPRDMPLIEFRFFEDDEADKDIQAMKEGIEFARKVFAAVPAPLAPFTEADPCANGSNCNTEDWIKTQAWSHHATSSCSIGADDDPLAVLDSKFRVRGVDGLRVVDASVFPRIPGAFPVLPTWIVSAKAADVILKELEEEMRRK